MDAYKRRQVAYDSTDRGAFKGPVDGPWIQAAVLKFIKKVANMEMMELSRAPVIASHSSARALNDVSRNMDDELLMKLKDLRQLNHVSPR